ncbi:MAG: BrnT family toxin [Gammaproteobacteria bacterium]|nr:BrnT family toxin [Gammaproteobacteria bacterium]
MKETTFEWDSKKNQLNIKKHGVDFYDAQQAFLDKRRIIAEDLEHSCDEKRYFCFGKVSNCVMTVRFTWRNNTIRIIGAGYWRKGRKIYDEEQT